MSDGFELLLSQNYNNSKNIFIHKIKIYIKRSFSWTGHQICISLLINQFLNATINFKDIPFSHEFILNWDLLA